MLLLAVMVIAGRDSLLLLCCRDTVFGYDVFFGTILPGNQGLSSDHDTRWQISFVMGRDGHLQVSFVDRLYFEAFVERMVLLGLLRLLNLVYFVQTCDWLFFGG